ncbi:MAG: M48 family metalloprotease [Leptospirales bacterium]|nr:M48 family metalloprotease [Leptospirales bacterium]
MKKSESRTSILACWLVIMGLTVVACRNPYQDVEQEKQWAAEVRKKYTTNLKCNKSTDAAYLTRLLGDLVKVADQNPYTFEVCLDDSAGEVNAYAFPAGYIVVNAGLLRAVGDESELVVVLSHEISHVILRHSFKSEKKKQWGSEFFGSMKNPVLRIPAQLFGGLGMLKYSREYEKYADLMGIEITGRAGYSSYSAISFFSKLESLEFQRHPLLLQLLSTHPSSKERLKYIKRQINRSNQQPSPVNSKEFEEMKKRYPRL